MARYARTAAVRRVHALSQEPQGNHEAALESLHAAEAIIDRWMPKAGVGDPGEWASRTGPFATRAVRGEIADPAVTPHEAARFHGGREPPFRV
jgi:hypothetical protein